MFGNKPAFGAAFTGGGSTGGSLFGNQPTASPFGQQNPAAGGPFSTPQTSFGATGGAGLFGSTPGSALFGSPAGNQQTASAPGTMFGATHAATNPGSGLFGNNNTVQGSSLFGQPQSAAAGGIFNSKPAFGFGTSNVGTSLFTSQPVSTGFGTSQNQIPAFGVNQTSIFGSVPSSGFGSTQPSTAGVFGATASTGLGTGFNKMGTGFGSNLGTTGTVTKFAAVTGSETVPKNGINVNISTKLMSISGMKDYETKSHEELRLEDYAANRKGPQTGGMAATSLAGGFNQPTSFGSSTQTSFGFGAQPATSAPVFGQTSQAGGSVFGAKTTATGFGGTNTFSTGFGTGLFGASTQSSSGGLFGTSNTNTITSNAGGLFSVGGFGQNQAKPAGLFGASTGGFGAATSQPAQPTMQFGTAPTSSGSLFGNVGTSSLFGTTPASSTNTFNNQTAKPTFGFGSLPGASGFGFGTAPLGGTAASSAPLFGAQSTSVFSTPKTSQMSAFGALNKPTGLGTGFGGFGSSGSGLGLGTSFGLGGQTTGGFGFGQASGLTSSNAAPVDLATLSSFQQQHQIQQQLKALSNSPFGDSLLTKVHSSVSKASMDAPTCTGSPSLGSQTRPLTSNFKVSSGPFHPAFPKQQLPRKSRLMGDLQPEPDNFSQTLSPRTNRKKLVLPSTVNPPGEFQSLLLTHNLSDSIQSGVSQGLSVVRPSPLALSASTPSEIVRQKTPSSPLDDQGMLNSPAAQRTVTFADSLVDTVDDQSQSDEGSSSSSGNVSDTEETPSDGDEGHLCSSRTTAGHACKVVLARPEYYVRPSLVELDALTVDDSYCIVKDLVVGREGYGEVKFLGSTDVYGLNLDNKVFFRRCEVDVYPDDYVNKPSVGKELNKPSEVTLLKVWVHDRTTKAPIKSPERLNQNGFLTKLEKRTRDMGSKFLDYRPDEGAWVFRVDHFTRYGLSDVDFETDDEMGDVDHAKAPKMVRSELEDPAKLSRKTLPIESAPALSQDPYEDFQLIKPESFSWDPVRRQLTMLSSQQDMSASSMDDVSFERSYGIVADKSLNNNRRQQAKREDLDSTNSDKFPYTDATITNLMDMSLTTGRTLPLYSQITDTKGVSMMRSAFFGAVYEPDEKLNVPFKSFKGSFLEKGLDSLPLVDTKKGLSLLPVKVEEEEMMDYGRSSPMALPKTVVLTPATYTCLGMAPGRMSTSSCTENLIADLGLVMQRSFRVGWAPGGTLACIVRSYAGPSAPGVAPASQPMVTHPYTVHLLRLSLGPSTSIVTDLKSRLELALHHSKAQSEGGVPGIVTSPGDNLLTALAEISDSSHGEKNYEALVWNLADALWGRLMDVDCVVVAPNHYLVQRARREAVSRWIQTASQPALSEEMSSHRGKDNGYLNTIASYVNSFAIGSACKLSMEHRCYRLALVLSVACTDILARQTLHRQLGEWTRTGADLHMKTDLVRLYCLAAGVKKWRLSNGQTVDVFGGLEWHRCLGIHMWYLTSSAASVGDCLHAYKASFEDSSVGAAPPLSKHVVPSLEDPVYDLCYHLMCLYCTRGHPVECTLSTRTHSPCLDYGLSFLLFKVLSALGYAHLPVSSLGNLVVSFAAQMELAGMFEWALFALLHLPDASRIQLVKDCLIRNYSELGLDVDSDQMLLLQKLGVPRSWISEALAVGAKYEGLLETEVEHLLDAGLLSSAHSVLMDFVGPAALVHGDLEYLRSVLERLSSESCRFTVPYFTSQGEVYLEYVKLKAWMQKEKTALFRNIEEELIIPVRNLLGKIRGLPRATHVQQLAASEIAVFCYNTLLLLREEAGQSTPSAMELVALLTQLSLPPDCLFSQLRNLQGALVEEIASDEAGLHLSVGVA